MAEHKTIRLEKHQIEAIEDMVDRGEADTQTEAHRILLNAGKREFGYKHGGCSETRLRSTLRKARNAFAWVAVALIGATWFYPVEFRLLVFMPLFSAGFLYLLDDVVGRHEPKVTKRLKGLFGGERV